MKRLAGPWKDCVIAKAGTISGAVDLEAPYEFLSIIIPTIDTAQLTIQVAEESGGTFQDLYITDPADGGDNKLISASGTGGTTWSVPLGGFQHIKITASAAQSSAARTLKVRGF